MLKWI